MKPQFTRVDYPRQKWDMDGAKHLKPAPEPKTPGTVAVEKHRPLLNKLTEPSGVGCASEPPHCSTAMKPLRLAVDTNVLLDLAEGVDAVVDTLALLDRRLPGNDMLVVPSVLDELAFLCDSGDSDRLCQSALRAVKLVREQDRFRPLLELAWPPVLVDEVAREIRSRGLLPQQEVHDSLILAEAALLGCGLLLTSDEHLRGVDHEHLTLVLNPFELVPPVKRRPKPCPLLNQPRRRFVENSHRSRYWKGRPRNYRGLN